MGDLAVDTELTIDERNSNDDTTLSSVVLSRDWEIWGPNGGYLAAIALRAAGQRSGRARPASLVGHFLGVASFEVPIEIRATTQRTAKVATSVHVQLVQLGKPIFTAMVWGVDDDLPGLVHQTAAKPAVASPSELPTISERFAADGVAEPPPPPYPFWDNFDQRPVTWRTDWTNRKTGDVDPRWLMWLRFVSDSAPLDPWVASARLAVLVDIGGWPAASAHHGPNSFIAPSIDLAVEFHCVEPEDWCLVDSRAEVAGSGLIGTHTSVYSTSGLLLAHGTSQLLCRDTGSVR